MDGIDTGADHLSNGRGLNCFHVQLVSWLPLLVIRISLVIPFRCNMCGCSLLVSG